MIISNKPTLVSCLNVIFPFFIIKIYFRDSLEINCYYLFIVYLSQCFTKICILLNMIKSFFFFLIKIIFFNVKVYNIIISFDVHHLDLKCSPPNRGLCVCAISFIRLVMPINCGQHHLHAVRLHVQT